MLVDLDSVIIIYVVEGPTSFLARARKHLLALALAGHQFVVSDLARLECRVKPLRLRDAALLADIDTFLNAGLMTRVSLTAVVYDRAAQFRADENFRLADSLHLAAALESGCDAFLTNDARLTRYPDVKVEILP